MKILIHYGNIIEEYETPILAPIIEVNDNQKFAVSGQADGMPIYRAVTNG